MTNNKIECLIDLEYNDNYYVLENSHLDLLNKNIQINGKIKILDNKRYYKNKLIHRLDGPAIEYYDGDKSWYKNGLLHRENGPAIEHSYGAKIWYENGLKHREDGPAIEYSTGEMQYWINGSKISEENFYLEKELRDFIINNNKAKKNKI